MIERLRDYQTEHGEIPSNHELRSMKHRARLSIVKNTGGGLPQTRAFWGGLIMALGLGGFLEIGREKMEAEHEQRAREIALEGELLEQRHQYLSGQDGSPEQDSRREITVGDLIPEGGSITHRVAKMREAEHRHGASLRSESRTRRVAAMRAIRHGR